MLIRTHLVAAFFVALLFLGHVSNPFWFVIIVLISVAIPDMDSVNSKLGKSLFSKILTAFTKHRGIMHSLLFLMAVYFILIFYFPPVAFGFLVGYGTHLIGDIMTRQGVNLFYPLGFKIKGFIKTGGKFEESLFLFFGLVDVALLISKIVNLLSFS